jgi:hypothetical protein
MKSKIKKYEFHSVANIFPLMTTIELDALKQDIKKNGLREPIYLFQDKIIDGRNRYLACLEIGINPKFRIYDGHEADLIDFVISLNLHRRHLNLSQKACLSVEILPMLELQTKENLRKKMSAIKKGNTDLVAKLQQGKSSEQASKIFQVSQRYILDAKKLFKENIDLFQKVRNGDLTLQQAKKELQKTNITIKDNDNIKDNVELYDNLTTIELTKTDLKKVSELVTELNISEQKAKDYILKKKSEQKQKKEKNRKLNNENNAPQKAELKEIKFRLTADDKEKIVEIAKQKHLSVSKFINEVLVTNILK